ncbi:caspase family protein [Virgisporangium aurantiacum]
MTKRAVVVGINDYSIQDPSGGLNLNCCVSDATMFYHTLVDSFDVKPADIYYYADRSATRDTILRAVSYITSIAEPGDVAVFYYSGHGARVRAESGHRDVDSYYEALVPAAGDFITDWDFARVADSLRPEVCNFTLVIDACHSGGLHDTDNTVTKVRSLRYSDELIDLICSKLRTLIPVGICLPLAAHQQLAGNVSHVRRADDGTIDLDEDLDRVLVRASRSTLLSGCRYDESTWESSTLGHGLMTQALLDAFNRSTNTQPSYREVQDDLRSAVRQLLEKHILPTRPGVTQTPQLRGQDNRMDEGFLDGWTFTPA